MLQNKNIDGCGWLTYDDIMNPDTVAFEDSSTSSYEQWRE